MRKLPTGELCAGEPHAQFGGRGGRASFPTPIIVAKRSLAKAPAILRDLQKADVPLGSASETKGLMPDYDAACLEPQKPIQSGLTPNAHTQYHSLFTLPRGVGGRQRLFPIRSGQRLRG